MSKRFFSSTSAAQAIKPNVARAHGPTRPRVYAKMQNALAKGVPNSLPLDAQQAMEQAREKAVERKEALKKFALAHDRQLGVGLTRAFDAAETLRREGVDPLSVTPRLKHPHDRFLQRLKNDGGDKIITTRSNVLHTMHSRFVPLLNDIRGLPLQDALLTLAWHRKRITSKVSKPLENALVKAKLEGNFDLEKTYVADAFIKPNGAVLSTQFRKRFLKGRGRYGSTQHAITAMLELTLQEREKPFARKVADPLEWVRARLRARVGDMKKGDASLKVQDVFERVSSKKVVKEVFC
ncbi:hypothetical protein BJ741DRAFT_715630 [Chytriomyces cf. hyalinus JEL632]|nr:hypothetical protein BJ741DRAFT_715630 [Chytriomyces cf. hyalinus JEL632]